MSAKYPGPIQLHADFNVDLTREKEFLDAYENFKKVVAKAPGFRACRLMKIRPADEHEHAAEERWKKLPGGAHPAQIGKTPEGLNYRLVQEWESEDIRWKWNPTKEHDLVWHPLEQPLKKGSSGYLFTTILWDVCG